MTWAQIADLAADGNEIGGHTIDHANLKHLKEAAARDEVCDAYSITPADLQGLLDFLAPRAAIGTVVRTTQEVIGGPFQPPVPAW